MAGDAGRDAGGPAGQGQGLWKLEVARQVLAEDYGPRLDWVAVAKALDHDRFNIPDQASASCLLSLVLYLVCCVHPSVRFVSRKHGSVSITDSEWFQSENSVFKKS